MSGRSVWATICLQHERYAAQPPRDGSGRLLGDALSAPTSDVGPDKGVAVRQDDAVPRGGCHCLCGPAQPGGKAAHAASGGAGPAVALGSGGAVPLDRAPQLDRARPLRGVEVLGREGGS